MGIDEALLQRHKRFQDHDAGVTEEFLQPKLGQGNSVAVLSSPLGPRRPLGWVICHSFSIEQINLWRLGVVVARALAAQGYPVLRYHGQGYGDADGRMEEISLSSHIGDATDAVRLMREQEGVSQVGVLGPRFGGLVAALVADACDLPCMALWEPVVAGSQFMRDFLRSRVLSEMVDPTTTLSPTRVQELKQEILERGQAEIRGFPLTLQAYQEITSAELAKDVRRFRGRALLLGISRSGTAGAALLKLADHLRSIGAECDLQVVQERLATQFGQFHFQTTRGGQAKRDTQLDLYLSLANATVDWANRIDEAASLEGGPARIARR